MSLLWTNTLADKSCCSLVNLKAGVSMFVELCFSAHVDYRS